MVDRVLLVGESNPYGADPRLALYPEPPGCAGARLCVILGMTDREYLRTFHRVNLLEGPRWSAAQAKIAAGRWVAQFRVLLGARVTRAHDFDFKPWTRFDDHRGDCEYDCPRPASLCMHYVILPHPSGRSRLWNEPGAAERAPRLVLALVEEARHG